MILDVDLLGAGPISVSTLIVTGGSGRLLNVTSGLLRVIESWLVNQGGDLGVFASFFPFKSGQPLERMSRIAFA